MTQLSAARLDNAFETTQSPVIMLLLREKLFSQSEDGYKFGTKYIGVFESFGVEQHLSNNNIIRDGHRDRSKKLFKIVG